MSRSLADITGAVYGLGVAFILLTGVFVFNDSPLMFPAGIMAAIQLGWVKFIELDR